MEGPLYFWRSKKYPHTQIQPKISTTKKGNSRAKKNTQWQVEENKMSVTFQWIVNINIPPLSHLSWKRWMLWLTVIKGRLQGSCLGWQDILYGMANVRTLGWWATSNSLKRVYYRDYCGQPAIIRHFCSRCQTLGYIQRCSSAHVFCRA